MNLKYGPHTVAEWARLKRQGLSFQEIGDRCGVACSSVFGALKAAGFVKLKKGTVKVCCLRCDRRFESPTDRHGRGVQRICPACTKYNQQTFEGAMFI